MALSNIFKEPRREITESAIGILAAVGSIAVTSVAVYYTGVFVHHFSPQTPLASCVGTAIFLLPATVVALIGLAVATHAIGESVCASLAKRNLDPRPKQRYK